MINIQAEVEKPFLYIMARCPSNEQQLLCAEERMKDILNLNEDLALLTGIKIHDVFHFFKGDAPARQFEAGHQKGGNYVCVACSIHCNLIHDLVHSYSLQNMSLEDRINKIRSSTRSCDKLKKNCTKLYENLKWHEFEDELHQRKIKIYHTMTLEQVRKLLESEMHGMQRLPSLFFNNPMSDLNDLNLPCYEILPHEPLHDISNHIKNLFNELVHHIPKKMKETFSNTIQKSFNGKDPKNSSDYRKSLLIVGNCLQENLPGNIITRIILTLAEIQEICYLPENERTPQKILHLNNLTFIHGMLLTINIRPKLKSLTERKLFGTYYHAITCHAPTQYRILSGRAANTEKEAFFTGIKTDTKLTSNYHPENLVTNAIVRAQAQKSFSSSGKLLRKESYIHNYYKALQKTQKITLILFQWIKTFPHQYQ